MIDKMIFVIHISGMNKNDRPKEPLLLREWAKYQLRLKGITFTALAKQHGARRDVPCIPFVRPFPKWERIVAESLGLQPEELWPERWQKRAARKGESTRKRRATQ